MLGDKSNEHGVAHVNLVTITLPSNVGYMDANWLKYSQDIKKNIPRIYREKFNLPCPCFR